MPKEENNIQTVLTLGNSEYSNVQNVINVNGGHVCIMIGQDIKEDKVLEILNPGKKKKKRRLQRVKHWLKKKLRRVNVPTQDSDNDLTSSKISILHQNAPSEEHPLPQNISCDSSNKTCDSSNITCDSSNITCDRHFVEDDDRFSVCSNNCNVGSYCPPTLRKGSFSEDNDTDEEVEDTLKLNVNYYDRECTGVKQSLQPQEDDLHLSCDYENSSHLSLRVLKPAEESTDDQDTCINVESSNSDNIVLPDNEVIERSLSSGYPLITLSSRSMIESTRLGSNDDFPFQMCDSYVDLKQDKRVKNDRFNDNACMTFGSKMSETERRENVHSCEDKPFFSSVCGERKIELTKIGSSSLNMDTPSDFDITLDQIPSVVQEVCQNDDSFECAPCMSTMHSAENGFIITSPCVGGSSEFNETWDCSNANENTVCSDSGSSQDTITVQEYADKLVKSNNCHENVDIDVTKPSKEIECFASTLTDQYAACTKCLFCKEADVENFLLLCLRNWLFNVLGAVLKYQTSVGTKTFRKYSISDSIEDGKPQFVGADYTNFGKNENQQVGIRDCNLFLVRRNLKPEIFWLRNLIYGLCSEKHVYVIVEKSSLFLWQNKFNMVRLHVPECVSCAGKDFTDKHLIVTFPEKHSEPITVEDTVLTESREVLVSTNPDLDYLGEKKFSLSTLPVSGGEDTPQKTHRHKKKKRLRKKCKKSEFSRRETSSLDSSSSNENLTDDDSSSLNEDVADEDSPPLSLHYSIHRANRQRRRKQSPKTNDSTHEEGSNFRDSALGSSIVSNAISSIMEVPWNFDINFDSEVIDYPKMKKRTKSVDLLRRFRKPYSFKNKMEQFFRNKQRESVKSIVRELQVDHRHVPLPTFGLGSYFDRLNNGPPPSQQEQMRYEWLRLASFQHYTGAGNAMNLARNGFYHRHTDGPMSTRCVHCNETCGSWEYFDDVAAIHRRLSPNCPFHTDPSDESLNVSINCDGPASVNQNSNTGSSSSENSSDVATTSASSMFTLKPTMTLASAVNEVTRGLKETHVSQAKPNNTNVESVPQQPTEDPEGLQPSLDQQRRTNDTASGHTRTSSNAGLPPVSTESRATPSRAGAGNFVDPSPIGKHTPQPPAPVNRDTSPPTPLDNVKHPEYRTMAQRVNSFNGFPEYLDQTAEQMALAGFYFVGVADFTRCFCCGGGLRNWEAGDDPLLEHTRWFPRCGYVLRLKGERYVAAVQRRHQEHMAEQRQQQIQLANQRDANRTAPDPLTTDAARVMREMGYPDTRIRETILAVRRQVGTHLITTQQVLSWLLDQDDDTTETVSRSMYQTGNNDTSSIYTGITMTNENDDSFTTATQFSMNSNVSSTAAKTREAVQGTGTHSRETGQGTGTHSSTNTTTTTSTATPSRNQQTDTKSAASGADTSQGASGQSGTKRSGKKKKGKGNGKPGQTAAAGAGAAGASGTTGTTGNKDAAKKLLAENEKLRDMQTCKICMERVVNTTLLPCGHLVCCDICAARLRDCPVCRKKIKGTVKTFMS